MVINIETGQLSEVEVTPNKKLYSGPRRYSRVMGAYDTSQLLLCSKVGLNLLMLIRDNTDNKYRIRLIKQEIAKKLHSNRETISRNIKKLVEHGYLIDEGYGKYFVLPNMFWSRIDGKEWRESLDEFKSNENYKELQT
jgi:predicted transcriptional regulator